MIEIETSLDVIVGFGFHLRELVEHGGDIAVPLRENLPMRARRIAAFASRVARVRRSPIAAGVAGGDDHCTLSPTSASPNTDASRSPPFPWLKQNHGLARRGTRAGLDRDGNDAIAFRIRHLNIQCPAIQKSPNRHRVHSRRDARLSRHSKPRMRTIKKNNLNMRNPSLVVTMKRKGNR